MAWENNPTPVLQSAKSRGRGGHGLAILYKHVLQKEKIPNLWTGVSEKIQLLHFCLLFQQALQAD